MELYQNPVLDADWPDPDAIRVGEDYWMIASSFNRAPGLPVLHSRDLVSWEHVSNALPANLPEKHYSVPRHGCGVWAPSIRHHQGTYYIVYPDPDFGIYVLTAEDPRGEWSTPHLLLPGRGLIDPCPLWDDDGRAYLVHGWAKSRAGFKNKLTVVEVDPHLRGALDHPQLVVDGDALPGYGTLEGPKFYKHEGWYWIFAPAGGVATGWQSVFRSRSVYGPYEDRIVLEQESTNINGPHQGAWVTTAAGEHWFLHFQDRDVFGRVVHLQPMTWGRDGWPRMGEPFDEQRGRPVTEHRRPTPCGAEATATRQREPQRSDDFRSAALRPRWHWQANPQPAWSELRGDGTLRLRHLPLPTENLREHPAVLAQPLPGRPSEWTTAVELNEPEEGDRAGLVILGAEYAWIGLQRQNGATEAVCRIGSSGQKRAKASAPAGARIQLRAAVDEQGTVRLSWRSRDTETWQEVLEPFEAVKGRWIGAEIGVFAAAAPLDAPDSDSVLSSEEGTGKSSRHAIFSAVTVHMGDRMV